MLFPFSSVCAICAFSIFDTKYRNGDKDFTVVDAVNSFLSEDDCVLIYTPKVTTHLKAIIGSITLIIC